jgi:hypothetical protein
MKRQTSNENKILDLRTLGKDAHSQRTAVLATRYKMSQRMKITLQALALLILIVTLIYSTHAVGQDQTRFKRIPTEFIAALAEPGATSGSNAQSWGLWPLDPGPRGVRLNNYERMKAAGNVAPSKWKFDSKDWWLEEHGLIMENPVFPLSAGKYMVTGDREMTSVLTIHPMDKDGNQHWELDNGATLYDVTHLACRSAKYTPLTSNSSCSPSRAKQTDFPVIPGGPMPPVEGCNKLDYAVLLVIGVAVDN